MPPFEAVATAAFRAPMSIRQVIGNAPTTPTFAQKFQARASLAGPTLLAVAWISLFHLPLVVLDAQAFTDGAVFASCRPTEAADMLPSEACLCSAEGLDSIPTPEWYLGHLARLHAAGAMSAAELRAAINEAVLACVGSPGTVKRLITAVAPRPVLPTDVTLIDHRRSTSKSR